LKTTQNVYTVVIFKIMLHQDFFSSDPCHVAQALIGKVIRRKYKAQWLAARIIETEAYYLSDKITPGGMTHSISVVAKKAMLF